MASLLPVQSSRTDTWFLWASVAANALNLWVSRRWPDTLASTFTFYGMSGCFLAWFGFLGWTGYQRRRPYWTAESWRRYLRLSALPVLALILLFGEMTVFDSGPNRTIFGAPGSTLREIWILIDLGLMAFGAIGLVVAITWLRSGEPSNQFTRRRLFPYRWRNSQLTRED